MERLTVEILRQRQAWSLEQKIDHALATLDVFISRMQGKAFVSCSFGKDSLALLDLARRIKPDILAVWCNTGMENPSLVKAARERIAAGENIRVIRPSLTFAQVVARYGFPLVSKETSYKIWQVRSNPTCASSQKFVNDRKSKFCLPQRWMWLIDERFDTSNKCCKLLKKDPMRRFIKESGLSPILGTMACESEMRKGHYLRGGGCNVWSSSAVPLPPPTTRSASHYQYGSRMTCCDTQGSAA